MQISTNIHNVTSISIKKRLVGEIDIWYIEIGTLTNKDYEVYTITCFEHEATTACLKIDTQDENE